MARLGISKRDVVQEDRYWVWLDPDPIKKEMLKFFTHFYRPRIYVIDSDFEDGGDMWTGTGPRERRKYIAFSEPFKSEPLVHVALSMWDTDNLTNQRADVHASSITEAGFTAVFRTWGDTRVARVRVGWMAIGELGWADEWELY